jgi:hypothetical protein
VGEFSHVGMPTDRQREGETFLEEAGVHVTDFASRPYGFFSFFSVS